MEIKLKNHIYTWSINANVKLVLRGNRFFYSLRVAQKRWRVHLSDSLEQLNHFTVWKLYFQNISRVFLEYFYSTDNISMLWNWTKLWKLDFPTFFYNISILWKRSYFPSDYERKTFTVPLKNFATTAKHQTLSTPLGGFGAARRLEPSVASRQTPSAVGG